MKHNYFFDDINIIDLGMFRVLFLRDDNDRLKLEFEVWNNNTYTHGIYSCDGTILYDYTEKDIDIILNEYTGLKSIIGYYYGEFSRDAKAKKKRLVLESHPAYNAYGMFMDRATVGYPKGVR